MFELDGNLATEYLLESRALLAVAETDLRAMEDAGASIDEECVNRVFRAVHTIKGGAGFFDLAKIRELAHGSEGVLSMIRARAIVATPGRIRVLMLAAQQLKAMVGHPAMSNRADIAELLAELSALHFDRLPGGAKSGAPAAQDLRSTRGRLRVLLVEDDYACRLVLQSFLSRYGECHIAINGRQAVDAFGTALNAGKSFDLVCMDIMMPEMDGREAVRHVRALEEAKGIYSTEGAKIFMTTAIDEVKQMALCFKELCDAYLMKPIDLGKLLSEMQFYRMLE
jgi:two-component system chemotaxis response regulator CheY